MQPKRLSVLGVGLLGGSLGLAVKSVASDCRVIGYGHRRATLDAALALGAIDEGYDDPAAAVRDADLVVLCTPVSLLGEMLDRIAPFLADRAVVTDVGSTKASIVRLSEERHPGIRFVGSHPMAGSEKRGVQFAQSDLFRNAVCITTPTDATDREALEAVEGFWRGLGMRLKRCSPAEHDRLICDVSHLPHAIAAALVTMQEDAALDLVGKGFLDATRIAGGDGGLWRDIFLDNRQNLAAAIGRLRTSLDDLERLLTPESSEALRDWLDRAAERRQAALKP
ncbi:prephenate dehydrogenase [Humisphaera borealis]|uniref:Prephenate dehydrogenase n=1 Tax=Humisphaera borealis TaxID=2807512 RepID=A0A7M2X180_9BACT|nr:prephenate dehydrogenase [Humisphaera borealis]QOV91435.1 prephenate dehydrogenase [Humisphaera borealis]